MQHVKSSSSLDKRIGSALHLMQRARHYERLKIASCVLTSKISNFIFWTFQDLEDSQQDFRDRLTRGNSTSLSRSTHKKRLGTFVSGRSPGLVFMY